MRKRSPNALAQRLARRAARGLPRRVREVHEQTWLNEMEGMETAEERLDFARGLRAAARGIRRELDPEGAFVGDLFRLCAGSTMTLLFLASHGVAPEATRLLAYTLGYGFVVLILSHLTAKCVLILPEVRRVWWRLGLLTLLGLTCAFWGLAFLTWWSANHPNAFLMMVVFAILGVRTARRFHVPRPPLAR